MFPMPKFTVKPLLCVSEELQGTGETSSECCDASFEAKKAWATGLNHRLAAKSRPDIKAYDINSARIGRQLQHRASVTTQGVSYSTGHQFLYRAIVRLSNKTTNKQEEKKSVTKTSTMDNRCGRSRIYSQHGMSLNMPRL